VKLPRLTRLAVPLAPDNVTGRGTQHCNLLKARVKFISGGQHCRGTCGVLTLKHHPSCHVSTQTEECVRDEKKMMFRNRYLI